MGVGVGVLGTVVGVAVAAGSVNVGTGDGSCGAHPDATDISRTAMNNIDDGFMIPLSSC
jgi:hypothetical protein